jgi:hypothetical protein
MSAFRAYPSNLNLEIYAYNRTLILVVGSLNVPFIGIGTDYKSFCSSYFSSSRTGINLNSDDYENRAKISSIPILGRIYSL